MPGLIYHKNELLKLLKSCKTMCAEHGKVTMVMCGKKKLGFHHASQIWKAESDPKIGLKQTVSVLSNNIISVVRMSYY